MDDPNSGQCSSLDEVGKSRGRAWMVAQLSLAFVAVTLAVWPWADESLPLWMPRLPALDRVTGVGQGFKCLQPLRSRAGERLDLIVANEDCRELKQPLDDIVTARVTNLRREQPKGQWLRTGLPFTKADPELTELGTIVRGGGRVAVSITSVWLGMIVLGAIGRLRQRIQERSNAA
jgi:hypothetical protein